MTIELFQPLLEDGIRNVNFFNGRLLSAEDLRAEQAASRQQHRQLGQAIGEGITYGLEVSRSTQQSTVPILTIKPGLAVNRAGDTLRLTKPIDVSLVRPQNGSAPAAADSVFSACQPPQSSVYVTGSGVYLLTMGPASGSEGRALVSGLENAVADCNTKYIVDGVQFRLIQLNLTASELNDARLRNIVTYKCLGVADTRPFVKDPFGPPLRQYGLLDSLRPNRLTDCDVPLAVLFWTATAGIKFIDMWSVRRRLTARAVSDDWPLVVGDRRKSESEAMFLQFENQIQDIRQSETGLAAIAATERFEFLPPVGLLPVTGPGSPVGFDPQRFFGARASRDVAVMDGDLLLGLLRDSFSHGPIDLSLPDKIQLYLIWENVRAVEQQQTNQLSLVFASHSLSYRGVARFAYAKWSLSRFAPSVI